MVFANRYTIIEEIGHGGMGRVYKAIDRSLEISVALKIIRPEYASNPRIIDHFKKETVLSRSITSENVVRVHDLGESENIKYISMDFVEGQNLRDLIQASGSLTISTAVKFGQQICSGLAAAHKQGIIHRDLKPSNVMIDRTGRARVMDFGLAKTIDREDAQGVRAVVGTPEYLSPEQARGEKQDQRTDIYALGLILYEIVTGRPVFEAESLTGYIKKHCEATPEPPSRLNPSVPAALESIILKCLKKDKNERYQTVEDVCRSLDLVVAPETPWPKTIWSLILRLSVWIGACLVIALAAYFLFFNNHEQRVLSARKSLAVMSFENVTGDPSLDNWRNLLRHLLTTDLEQSKFLRLVAREKLLNCLADADTDDSGVYASDVLEKIASRENVDFFLLGSYMKSGQGYRIDIRIIKARDLEAVGSRSFDAVAPENIQDRCDEISRWSKEQLGLSRSDLAKDFDEELKKYTTPSIEAVIHFSRGLDFYDKRDFKQSSDSYLRAVAVDQNFALAYARLAMNFTYEGRFEEANKYLLKAMSLRKNLTPRERLLIEGDYFNFLCDYPRAIETYKNLLMIYPDDEMALEHMGAIFRNTEEWDKAAECFERLHVINPNSRITVRNLSFIARAIGQYEKAANILQDNKGVFSATDEFQSDLAFCFLCQGGIDQALSELGKAMSLDPNRLGCVRLLGQIHSVMGNYRDAEAAYQRLLEDDRINAEKLEGRYWLGQLYLLQGKYETCSREIEEGLKLARSQGFPYEEITFLMFKSYLLHLQRDFARAHDAASRARKKAVEVRYREDEIKALHLMGLCEVGLGQLPEAQRTVLTMEQIVGKIGYSKLLRDCHHLEGMIAVARNSWAEAANGLSMAVEMLPQQHVEDDPHAIYLESLASALFQRGDPDSAREQYEKVISLTTGFLIAGDAYARSLYQLGRIYQEKNESARAKELFRKYLAVRGDADGGLAEVEDARKRLALIF